MGKRDLKADLELCNKATPGPWIDNGNEIVVPSNPNEGIAGALTDEDNAFISQAREGWPHAIERAIRAETLVRELVGVIDDLRRQINECGLDGEMWEVYERAKEVLVDA